MNKLSARIVVRIIWCAPVIAGALMLAGCLSTHPGSKSIAYVDIESSGGEAVRKEVVRVFEDDGYILTDKTDENLIFERDATQRDKVMYARYGDDSMKMRVVVFVEPRRRGGSLVRADAYVVRDSGGPDKVLRMARRPYQNLLEKVKASLVTAERSEKE